MHRGTCFASPKTHIAGDALPGFLLNRNFCTGAYLFLKYRFFSESTARQIAVPNIYDEPAVLQILRSGLYRPSRYSVENCLVYFCISICR